MKIKLRSNRQSFGRKFSSLRWKCFSKFYYSFSLLFFYNKKRQKFRNKRRNIFFFQNPFISSFPFFVMSFIRKTSKFIKKPFNKSFVSIDNINSCTEFSWRGFINSKTSFSINDSSTVSKIFRFKFCMSEVLSHKTKYIKDTVSCLAATTKFKGMREHEAIV